MRVQNQRWACPFFAFAGLVVGLVVASSGCTDDGARVGGDATVTPDVAAETDAATDDSAGEDSAGSETTVGCRVDGDCVGVFQSLDQCERAACNPDSGNCVRLARADGESCTDRNACTEGDRCLDGACVALGVLSCEDENPCTTDRCDTRDGCVFEPNSARCDDGSACTTNDTCDDRRCVGRAVLCDDDNPCTADRCDEASGGCRFEPVEGACNDGDGCTRDEICVDGRCVGEPVPGCVAHACGDGACNLDESCTSCPADCATCCGADEVVDCAGGCVARDKVGNASCQLALACAATDWDAGDCPMSCADGEVEDCVGRCASAASVGDGVCHDGAGGGADFACAAHAMDGGDCASCGPTEIADCAGGCLAAWHLGDGACDEALACARHDFDRGDCCGASEVRGCGFEGVAACVDAGWVGDGICDELLNCAEHAFDAGDCTALDGCGEGGIGDCGGSCRPAALLGDGTCHGGVAFVDHGADFFCALFGFDEADCEVCASGEVAGCDGECREDTRGDATCDLALDCDKNDFDGGDCCPAGQRRDCQGDCEQADWIGDGYCDSDFQCLAFAYDGGDCARCAPDQIFDCNGECVAATLLGDGSCEDGRTARPDLRCEFFAHDGGDCALCPAGQVPSCDGTCLPAARLGDGTCDAELACLKWELDRGDCCDKDEVRNCEGGCSDVRWISDSYCDQVLDCVALRYDGGDCTDCGANEISDCNGQCYPDAPVRIGDGVCDDGAAGIDLFCAYFEWDGGDCAACPEGQIPACGGSNCVADTVGDLVCDIALDCRKYGRDDCCGPGEIADCVGGCTPTEWLGDTVCDAALDCPGRAYDGGDCR